MAAEYDFSSGVRGSRQQKYFLNIAGEFYVAAELNRRGIFASVTYGAARNANVLAFDQASRQTAVIEVKTTALPNKKWITGQHSISLDSNHPQSFWVLVLLPDDENTQGRPRFFIFTSQELRDKVSENHRGYSERHQASRVTAFQDSRRDTSLLLEEAEAMQAEEQWSKISDWLARK